MAPGVIFVYRDRRVPAPASYSNFLNKIETVRLLAEEQCGVPPDTYDFYDSHGKIADREDLHRAIQSAGDECSIEVREHRHYVQIRTLEEQLAALTARTTKLEKALRASEQRTDMKVEEVKDWTKGLLANVDRRLQELHSKSEELSRDRNHLQRQTRLIEEKLNKLNVDDVRQMMDDNKETMKEMRYAIKRVDKLDHAWGEDKASIVEDATRTKGDLKELQRYVQGKIDVCIEADGDLRREQQLSHERMQLLADDLRLMTDEHKLLTLQSARVMEEVDDLRARFGRTRDETEQYRLDIGSVRTRVHCIEDTAAESWEGFAPGVLYCRQWHRAAKGADVKFSGDLLVATARGFLASNGHVVGNSEGLVLGDAPAGASASRAPSPPTTSSTKALVCRAGVDGAPAQDPPVPPATLAPGIVPPSALVVAEAMKTLQACLPPRSSGEVQQVESDWDDQALGISDRVGVLFKCRGEGGAHLRVAVNGEVVATHYFVEAPPAEALGFLTPALRLAGTGKSVRILPDSKPPPHMFAEL
eukprot:CAMPEP_0179370686 /NCGR_PEP_ID=MMETSP0797-20121207/85323_1 /TAXON_ID=47934 /ORGANISM="Dinophysis acuminata, Strain DAEP01" /LENGTH=530 /DNA_ID=CAMNT_0021086485 /DNA_START=74 /DNA_END=1667 /DNA_ORIENTATION=+